MPQPARTIPWRLLLLSSAAATASAWLLYRALRARKSPRLQPAETTTSPAVAASAGKVRRGGLPAFKVATWNVLAENYAQPKFYKYCPPEALRWEYRRERLLARLCAADCPQLLCLQEVQDWHGSWLQAKLKALGFDSVYLQRGGNKRDGCLISWNREVFEQVDQELCVDFNELADPNRHDRFRLLRHNVGLGVLLRHIPKWQAAKGSCRGRAGLVLVATTHLFWNPMYEDVKLQQIALLLHRLEERLARLRSARVCGVDCPAAAHDDGPAGPPALLLCGDFNSLPTSRVYRYVTEGVWPLGWQSEQAGVEKSFRLQLLLDGDMKKLSDWLGTVGVDAVCWAKGAGKDHQGMFAHALAENRLLVSHSQKLVQRRNCPPYLLIHGRGTTQALLQVLTAFDLNDSAARVRAICTLCDSPVRAVTPQQLQRDGTSLEFLPAALQQQLAFARCGGCQMLYWWSRHAAPESSDMLSHLEKLAEEEAQQREARSLERKRRDLKKREKPGGPVPISTGDFNELYDLHNFLRQEGKSIVKKATRKSDGLVCEVKIVNKAGCSKQAVESMRAEELSRADVVEVLESPKRLYVVTAGDSDSAGQEEEEESEPVEDDDLQEEEEGKNKQAGLERKEHFRLPDKPAHALQLASAYASAPPQDKKRPADALPPAEPLFTNLTNEFRGCIDYIFYSQRELRMEDVGALPSFEPGQALPSPDYPSDHVLLTATMSFR